MAKNSLHEFALLGGKPVFQRIRSISNLVRPDPARFFEYSRMFFQTGEYSGGGAVESLLEQRLAEFHEVRNCVSFCGGFWGLVLTMKCLALAGRTEVVMPSLTYRRLADIVAWAGLTPHFCEVDPQRLCITAETAAECINERTALLLGVHPIVNCCDADGLEALSSRTGIPLMFDSVESVYETYHDRKVGSFGRAECFSMQSSKLFNASEGGYVTTQDDELAQQLRAKRRLGVGADGMWRESGMNAAQSEIHAAMALAAIDGVHEQVIANRRRYERYRRRLAESSAVRLLQFDAGERHGYKNIVVELGAAWPLARAHTLELLHSENMLCRAYYAPALHQKKTGYPMIWSDLARTEMLAERFLMLPCGYFVSDDDVDQICDFLADVVRHGPALAATRCQAQVRA
jgi:dTDP-4-amino-4,6-dideoxygalactose transaminase